MMHTVTTFLRRFRREEDGQMLVEFALAVPLILTLFLTSVEMGIYAMRQNFLDRGLDMAIRDVRLNTAINYTHAQLKTMICENAGFLPDCDDALKLEMTPINPRSFAGFGGVADCIDVTKPLKPSRTFVHGGEHQLMMIRACYLFDPIFPTTGMGYAFTRTEDGSERAKMLALSAFVQEPNS